MPEPARVLVERSQRGFASTTGPGPTTTAPAKAAASPPHWRPTARTEIIGRWITGFSHDVPVTRVPVTEFMGFPHEVPVTAFGHGVQQIHLVHSWFIHEGSPELGSDHGVHGVPPRGSLHGVRAPECRGFPTRFQSRRRGSTVPTPGFEWISVERRQPRFPPGKNQVKGTVQRRTSCSNPMNRVDGTLSQEPCERTP